jgi:hypothetical protein
VTHADIDRVLELLPGMVAQLRAVSPLYQEHTATLSAVET